MRPARALSLVLSLAALAPPAAAQDPDPPPEDATDYRLFAGPTGRTLEGGTATVGVIELFFPNVTWGITDRLQLGAGTIVAPEVVGEIFWLEPKVGLLSRPGVDLAAGVIAFFATGSLDEGSVGAAYLTGTFGRERAAFTVGAAWPFYADPSDADSEWVEEPAVSLGGELWAGENVKLVTENHFVFSEPDVHGLVTGGVRIVAGRLSADVGVAGALGEEQGCCLPIVNFSYAFGGGR